MRHIRASSFFISLLEGSVEATQAYLPRKGMPSKTTVRDLFFFEACQIIKQVPIEIMIQSEYLSPLIGHRKYSAARMYSGGSKSTIRQIR